MSDQEKWATAVLRVWSETMAAADIAARMDATPSRSRDIGEPMSRRAQRPVASKTAWCIWESGLDNSAPLEEHIAATLALAERNSEGLTSLASSCRMDIQCAFGSASGQGSAFISASTFKRLSELGIDMIIDLYPPPQSGWEPR